MLSDNRKIGIGLCALGALLDGLGILLLFDRILLSLANVAFILGIGFIVGPYGTARFFFKREKLKGSFFFFTGFGIIVFRWAIIGLLLQTYGVWLLFNALLPNILASLKLTPLGFLFELPGLKQVSNWIYDQRRLPL